MPRRLRIAGILALAAIAAAGPFAARRAASQQPEATPTPRPGEVSTTVRVELVLLDVLAIDGRGRPVLDLRADEIDVRIAGRPQQLEAFEPPPAPAASAGAKEPEVIAGSTRLAVKDGRPPLHLLFLFDYEELPPAAVINGGKQALDLARRSVNARISLVTHFAVNGTRLWEETSVERVENELTDVAESPGRTIGNDTSVSARRPGMEPVGGPTFERGYEARRRRESELVRDVLEAEQRGYPGPIAEAYRAFQLYLRGERMRVADSVKELHTTLERFAELGDRRHAVVFSQGFERVPGASAANFLEQSRRTRQTSGGFSGAPPDFGSRPISPEMSSGSLSGGMAIYDSSPLSELVTLEKWLAESGVMLHFVDPTAGADLPSAEHGAFEVSRDRTGDRRAMHEGASRLAEPTGGLVRNLQGSIAPIADALEASYRLAVRVSGVEPSKSYAVKVRSKRGGVTIRARSSFRPAAPGTLIAAAAGRTEEILRRQRQDDRRPGAARLVAPAIPLTATWKGKRGKLHVLEVRVPHDSLRFEHEQEAMVASVKFAVTATPIGGAPLDPVIEDAFLALTGEEYAAARGTDLVRPIRFELPPGKYDLRITIEDALEESAGATSLTVDAEP